MTLPAPDPAAIARALKPQLDACDELLTTVWQHRPLAQAGRKPHHYVLMSFLGRGTQTFRAVVELARSGLPIQAMMLTRSLFEDTVLAFWAALPANRDQVVELLTEQEDQIALRSLDLIEKYQAILSASPHSDPELEALRPSLEKKFGRHGLGHWAPNLHTAIADIRELWSEHGDPDQLDIYYDVMQWHANMSLHTSVNALKQTIATSAPRVGYFSYGVSDAVDEKETLSALRAAFFSYWHLGRLVLAETGSPLKALNAREEAFRVAFDDLNPRKLRQVGRNDLCPCGSGRKFKKCHGA